MRRIPLRLWIWFTEQPCLLFANWMERREEEEKKGKGRKGGRDVTVYYVQSGATLARNEGLLSSASFGNARHSAAGSSPFKDVSNVWGAFAHLYRGRERSREGTQGSQSCSCVNHVRDTPSGAVEFHHFCILLIFKTISGCA